jgi:environmental stress-induced protein Ves
MPARHAQLLSPSDYRSMPWKNGQGSTTEIAVFPAGASLAAGDFLWRVSMAEIKADGDFSSFPGYERSLLLASGNGMELDFDAGPPALLATPGTAADFSGDWRTRCRLLDGPVRDFNVMSARGRAQHFCEVVRRETVEYSWAPQQETLLCYCIRGTVVLKMRGVGEWNLAPDYGLYLPAHAESRERGHMMLVSHARDTLSVMVRLRQFGTESVASPAS